MSIQAGSGGAFAPGDAGALAKDDPAQPGREGPGLAEVGKPAVSGEEGLLGGVLGQVEISEDGIGTTVGHVLKSLHDLTECFEPSGKGEAAVSGDDD